MIGYIYKTTNTVNGRIYIGKRQKGKFDKSYYGSGTALKPALKKYGKNAFHVEVLEWCETASELCEAEKKWIARFREDKANLYNIADGGDGGCLVKWWEFSEVRKKEIIKKNSDAHKGSRNPMYGTVMTQEQKEFRRLLSKGKPLNEERKARIRDGKRKHLRSIYQINKDTGEIIKQWPSWAEAGQQFKASHGRCAYGHIAECCNGERKSAYGYRWAFAEVATI